MKKGATSKKPTQHQDIAAGHVVEGRAEDGEVAGDVVVDLARHPGVAAGAAAAKGMIVPPIIRAVRMRW